MSDVLANRASTFSKGHEFWSGDPDWHPKAIVSGRGASVLGDDGTWYLDWVSSLGALLLGHPSSKDRSLANYWMDQVTTQVSHGAGFSLPHVSERRVAERLTAMLGEHVPGWQGQELGLRWVKTGSDACEAAIRMARTYTGRMRVVSVGYHGWSASAVSTTPPAWGVPPQQVEAVPFGDMINLASRFGNYEPVAAVIIEQPPQPISDGYWQGVRRLCDRYGALLIVDEVVTGLRYAMGGACERFDIHPDLVCVGKGYGNTLPIAAVVGKRDIFTQTLDRSDPVFISSTHFGEAVGLAACDAVLDVWDQAAVDHIWGIGGALMLGLKEAGYEVVGYPPVSLIQHPSDAHRAFFIRGMRDRGVLMNRPNIPNLSHTIADVELTVKAAEEVKREIDAGANLPTVLPAVLFRNR